MFGAATEKRVMREANRIVSLREDKDAASWERVLEIGALLQDEAQREHCAALGAELAEIAHSNLSLLSRLGIDPEPSVHVMPSGIEVLEGGLAEAALEEQQAAMAKERAAGVERGDGAPAEITVPVRSEHLLSKTRSIESLRSDESWDELLGSIAEERPEEPSEEGFAERPEEQASESLSVTSDAAREPEDPGAAQDSAASLPVAADAAGVSEEPAATPDDAPRSAVSQAGPAPLPVSADAAGEPGDRSAGHEEGPRSSASQEDPAPASSSQPAASSTRRERFARFRTLYESRDHSLCVFEDEHGHLVAVDASKLA